MSIQSTISTSAGKIIGLAMVVVILATLAGLAILGSATSTAIASANAVIVGFIVIVALAVVIGIVAAAFGGRK